MSKQIQTIIAVLLLSFALLLPQQTNAQWSELGGINSLVLNGDIRSICSDKLGNIYAAGVITNSSGNLCVAKWDGNSWSELGGLNSLTANGFIYAICSDTFGNIYAAGGFKNDSGKRYVAKWDGNSWSELGGLNGLAANYLIYSMCIDASGYIYVGGGFTNSSGNTYVAKWNGSSWSELGGLNSLQTNNGAILALYCDAYGNIYVGGDIFIIGSPTWCVAEWNGSSWSKLDGLHNRSYTICTDAFGNIYAAGELNNTSGKFYVAKRVFNGWSELGGLNGLSSVDYIQSICSDVSGNIYASSRMMVNSTLKRCVAKWDGNNWSAIGGLNGLAVNNTILSVYRAASGDIYAGGLFTNDSGKRYVAKYHDPTGINETPTSSISISPNPTSGQVTIKGITNPTIAVYNLMGQKVVACQGSNEVSLAHLPAGMYLVQVYSKDMELVNSEQIMRE